MFAADLLTGTVEDLLLGLLASPLLPKTLHELSSDEAGHNHVVLAMKGPNGNSWSSRIFLCSGHAKDICQTLC